MIRLTDDELVLNPARKEVVNEAKKVRIMAERSSFKYANDIKGDNHYEVVQKFGKRYFTSEKTRCSND